MEKKRIPGLEQGKYLGIEQAAPGYVGQQANHFCELSVYIQNLIRIYITKFVRPCKV